MDAFGEPVSLFFKDDLEYKSGFGASMTLGIIFVTIMLSVSMFSVIFVEQEVSFS